MATYFLSANVGLLLKVSLQRTLLRIIGFFKRILACISCCGILEAAFAFSLPLFCKGIYILFGLVSLFLNFASQSSGVNLFEMSLKNKILKVFPEIRKTEFNNSGLRSKLNASDLWFLRKIQKYKQYFLELHVNFRNCKHGDPF